jgi:hypothetical protein
MVLDSRYCRPNFGVIERKLGEKNGVITGALGLGLQLGLITKGCHRCHISIIDPPLISRTTSQRGIVAGGQLQEGQFVAASRAGSVTSLG